MQDAGRAISLLIDLVEEYKAKQREATLAQNDKAYILYTGFIVALRLTIDKVKG